MKPDETLKTRPTLLSKVRHGDEDGWSRFYHLYEDFIFSAARGAGLSHEESKDVLQEAMVTVRNYINHFVPDANRGRFRTWLQRIVHSRIADQYRKKKRNPLEHATRDSCGEDSLTSTTDRIPNLNEVELDRLLDGKLQQAIFTEAQRRVKETVRMQDYQAYDLFENHELSAKDVAISLGIAVSTVRVKALRVRRTVTREVRQIVKSLEQAAHTGDSIRMTFPPPNSDTRQAPTEPGYQLIKEIARGGYGHVYLFRRTDGSAERPVFRAGKFVYREAFGSPDDSDGGAAYQRAFEGLQNFCSLIGDSPYLLRISDVRARHEAGYFCYMMELADDLDSGRDIHPNIYRPRTLKNELERSGSRCRLPAKKCLEIAIALARGLQVLHEGGFTHRDVRPSNIIFVNGVAKLADIDLLAGHDAALASYIPKDYAAPEGSHSTMADIYSFGKTLYELCTGLSVKSYPCLPPDIRHWEDHAELLRINQVISKACARDLRKRFSSAQQLRIALEDLT